jgi:hypothetical protein
MKREIKKAEVTLYHVLFHVSASIHLHQIQGQQQIKRGGRNEAAPVEQLALSTFLLGNANNATDGGPKTWSSGCCGGPTLPTLSSFMRGGRLGERATTRLEGSRGHVQRYLCAWPGRRPPGDRLRLCDMHMGVGLNHTVYVRRQRGSLPVLLLQNQGPLIRDWSVIYAISDSNRGDAEVGFDQSINQ